MASVLGRSVVRKEDPNLLTGRGRFVDDLDPPHTVHLGFVRSTEAHARITGVDAGEARGLPGVYGVWTAGDLDGAPAMPSMPALPPRPVLARDTVHFVGEPVAVVAAADRYVAADAVARVGVDYDPLPAVPTLAAALAGDAPVIFPETGSNVVLDAAPPAGAAAAELAAAPRRLVIRLANQRCAAVPLETGGCLADWTDPDRLAVWATTQVPHWLRDDLAKAFGLAQHQVRVVAPDVGGGFGAKATFYPEFLLAPLLSRRLRRPVKYVETRSENMLAMTHGRGQWADVEVGFDGGGHLLALRVLYTQDLGGWPDPTYATIAGLTCLMSSGCYRIPTVVAGFRDVATTTTPISAYRGAGRPEAAFMIERVIDLVAAETGLDPVEVRRRNFIPAEEFPVTLPTGATYDSGDYRGGLDRLLESVDYPALRAEQVLRRDDPAAALLGIGFSTYVELGGVGPSAAMGERGGFESAQIRMRPDGSVVLTVGTSPHGQGHRTAFAQIAAEVLGVDMDAITVVHGDTEAMQEGTGTFGSRGAAVGGAAVHLASVRLRDKLVAVAAHLLEADPGDIEVSGGRASVRGSPEQGRPIAEVALTAYRPHLLPPELPPGLDAIHYHEPADFTYPFGAHCCVVEVDRATGQVRIVRYVAVDDCGTVINPLLADGQVMGGVAQGIAQALLEEVTYDDAGQPQSGTLLDYLVPGAPDLPAFQLARTVTPTPVNPLGAKGIGESGATGAPPAVVNAVVDALAHLGVRHLDMPLTPEKVWRAMRGEREG